MKVITKNEFVELCSAVLCEKFEVIGNHKFYLQVFTNEDQFFSKLIQYSEDTCMFNASELYARENNKYAFERLLEEGRATATRYLYDDLAEAYEHALTLLRNRDGA